VLLNLNGFMDVLFIPVELVIITIVVTRVYRSLSDYVRHGVNKSEQATPPVDLLTRKENSGGIPMVPVQIQVHTQRTAD